VRRPPAKIRASKYQNVTGPLSFSAIMPSQDLGSPEEVTWVGGSKLSFFGDGVRVPSRTFFSSIGPVFEEAASELGGVFEGEDRAFSGRVSSNRRSFSSVVYGKRHMRVVQPKDLTPKRMSGV